MKSLVFLLNILAIPVAYLLWIIEPNSNLYWGFMDYIVFPTVCINLLLNGKEMC